MRYFAFFLIAATLLLSTPTASFAYFATAKRALTVNHVTGVYAIDFEFGHDKHAITIPVSAVRGTTAATNRLSYEVYTDDGKIADGKAVGIVLSKMKIENGMYVVPKGKAASFTLLVIFTPTHPNTASSFHAQVTSLPFTFDRTQDLKLNPSELQYYVTKPLTLN